MNPIDLIITVCAVLSPTTCEETHLVFSGGGSLRQCTMQAQPYIAQWVGEHPKWTAVRWRCEYPLSFNKTKDTNNKPQTKPNKRILLLVAIPEILVGIRELRFRLD